MTFAFEYAQNRRNLLDRLLKLTIDAVEVGFKNVVQEGEFDIVVEIGLNDQRAEYEQMVVEGYGYCTVEMVHFLRPVPMGERITLSFNFLLSRFDVNHLT